MDIEEPKLDDTKPCPNCQKPILASATWCPNCGTDLASKTRPRYPIGWFWFALCFLILPFVSVGSCFVAVAISLNNTSSPAGNIVALVSTIVMVGSILSGFVLLIYNGIKGRK